MRSRWLIYVLAMILAITGYILLSPNTALAAGPDGGNVSVYVYHDVNEDGIWNWGAVAPPNMRGDYNWQWDHPCTHPSSACESAEIGLVGAHVALEYYGGETRVGETFHNGPAQFPVSVGTQVVGVDFLGLGDRDWMVTNVSQKTVNEPADSQFGVHLPLPRTGAGSMHVLLMGIAECDDCGEDMDLAGSAPTTYVVQSGDTLWNIAQVFGTTVDALASANGIANPDLIYAGEVLTIP